jgi:hypothetical protein
LIAGAVEESPHEYFYYFAGTREGVNLRAVRDSRWKLFVEREENVVKGVELYDLASDVSETRDRLDDHPDVAQRLERQAQVFYQEMVASQRPIGEVSASAGR